MSFVQCAKDTPKWLAAISTGTYPFGRRHPTYLISPTQVENAMRQVMVRYTVRPDQTEENTRLIEAVFASLKQEAPSGLTYSSYKLDDGVSFVHVATMRDENDNPLRRLDAFQKLTAGVKDRCEVAPVTTVLHEVGSYAKS